MVCAWLVVPRESNKEETDWCGSADLDDWDEEDELLLEEEDAGCWGKLGAPGEDQALMWGHDAPHAHAAG